MTNPREKEFGLIANFGGALPRLLINPTADTAEGRHVHSSVPTMRLGITRLFYYIKHLGQGHSGVRNGLTATGAPPPLPTGALPHSGHPVPGPAGLRPAAMFPERGPPRPPAHRGQGGQLR